MANTLFHKSSVLVVDDDRFASRLMEQVLFAFEWKRVLSVSDHEEAKEILQTTDMNCMVCDWLNDEADGLSLVKFVRTNKLSGNKQLPIVMYTGRTELDKILMARDAGVNEIVAKPLSPQQVMLKLRTAMFTERRFVEGQSYVGPDRRRRVIAWHAKERRGKFGLDQGQIDDVMDEGKRSEKKG